MNHLAHTLLAGAEDGVVVGGMLGDFWRGAPDPRWPAAVRAGVLLHRKIDVYTDSHPVVVEARLLFEPPWRRYAGILLDLYFDHALVRAWPRLGAGSLDAFSARIGTLLSQNEDWLPADLTRFAGYCRRHGLFAAYAQRAVLEQVLAGIGQRLRHANRLAESGPALWQHADQLDVVFERLFPDLDRYARELRAASGFA